MSIVRIWILQIQWLLLGRRSVVLIDHDEEAHARLMRGFGDHLYAKRFGFGIADVRLLPDGTTQGKSYVHAWAPLFPRRAMPTSDQTEAKS